jgi:hypothetical protein
VLFFHFSFPFEKQNLSSTWITWSSIFVSSRLLLLFSKLFYPSRAVFRLDNAKITMYASFSFLRMLRNCIAAKSLFAYANNFKIVKKNLKIFGAGEKLW